MSDWYSRRMTVVNKGFSGYNSRLMLRVMKEIIGPSSLDKPWKVDYPDAKLAKPVIGAFTKNQIHTSFSIIN